jgi:CubicO group peptidase (beta-lactamase class C family)
MAGHVINEYVPPQDGAEWANISAEKAGFDAELLSQAITLVQKRETPWQADLRAEIESGYFEPPPYNEIIGPTAPRGDPNGLLLRHGRVVSSWGNTRRVDMTFSVAKSYLSLLAGIAATDGVIADIDEPVARTVRDGGFKSAHNSTITWRHMLQQTSEWEGTLWGKSEQIDRNRVVSLEGTGADKGKARPLYAPGAYWEYNDVRVNRLSLALLRRFRRSLPEVFAERIMSPIGASSQWRWEGYRNSAVKIGGRKVISVPGGGHWGGGMFVHTEDQARVALLALRKGRWGDAQILPDTWLIESLMPCALNPLYGFMWWLNTGQKRFPSASSSSFFALGSGGNICWMDPVTDIVAVMRWVDSAYVDTFIKSIYSALRSRDPTLTAE